MDRFDMLKEREMLAAGDKPMKRPHRSHEENMEKRLITWFDNRWPRLKHYLHHSPNESRYATERSKHAEMGTRSGFPDLIWLIPVKDADHLVPFVGIEFKFDKGVQQKPQEAYEEDFKKIGAWYYTIKTDLKFKELIVQLLDKAVLAAEIYLTKDEERALKEAHREVETLRQIEAKAEAQKLAEKAAKRKRTRKSKV